MKTRAHARGLSVNDQHTSTHELKTLTFQFAGGSGLPALAGRR
jgi:hypothetical protein